MKKNQKLISILALLLLILFSLPSNSFALSQSYIEGDSTKDISCDLRMEERQLWIDHVSWTRSAITSILSSLEDEDLVVDRLLKNQDDIGNSIKLYYGDVAGNTLSKLLREHISLAGKVTVAAKTNNKADLDKYNKLWFENADEIANFLSTANPNYSNSTLKDMLHKHLEFVTAQVVARLNKDWKSDIKAYDNGEEHMIKFADIITDGIINQFPDKFN